jgi:hypothetical protein
MALIQGSGFGGGQRKRKKKKPITSAVQHQQGRGGVAPADYHPKPKSRVDDILAPPRTPEYHPLVQNIKSAHDAYKEYTGQKPDAGQMYAMLSAAPMGMQQNEWTKMFDVLDGPADPFTNSLGRTAVEYFTRFNAYPNSAKMMAFMEAKKTLGPAGDDTRQLFDVLGGPTDSTDITLQGKAAERAGTKSGGRKWGWTQKDLDSMDGSRAKADAERKLANTTIHGEEMDQKAIFDIMQARGWYKGTDFKGFIEDRQASAFYNDDGSTNNKAVLAQSVKGGHRLDSILNASSYVNLREGAGGKPRSALSAKQKQRLSAFAETLGNVDPNFWKYYGGKKKNLVWDEHFEAAAMQYIFLYAAPYAMSKPEEREGASPRKGMRQQSEYGISEEVVDNAMKLIEIASYGKIQQGDQLYQYLADQSTLGMKNDIRSPSDQVSGFKFYAFQKTAGEGMTDYQQLSAYAHTFGPDDLPADARARYDSMTGTYSGLMNLVDHTPTNPFNDIFEALVGGKPMETVSLGPGLDPIAGYSEERLQRRQENLFAKNEAEADRRDKYQKDKIAGARGMVGTTSGDEGWMLHIAMPVMMDVMDSFALAVDRAGMFAAMTASLAISGGYLEQDGKGGWKRSGIEWNPTKADFWTGKNAPANKRTISSFHDIWHESALATPTDDISGTFLKSPLMGMLLRDYGIEPEDHKTILTIASIGWGIGVGAVTDSWITAGAKAAAGTSAKIARKALSPGLALDVNKAERVVADVSDELAASYDPRTGKLNTVLWNDYVEAKRTLNLINRPRWWDTHATALARGEQSPEMIDRLLNINADQFHGVGEVGARLLKKRAAIIEIEKKIAVSRDADEITHLFN